MNLRGNHIIGFDLKEKELGPLLVSANFLIVSKVIGRVKIFIESS